MIEKLLRLFSRATVGLGMVLLGIMTIHVTLDVCLRWLWGSPLSGTIELVANYYMVALIYLPLIDVQREGAHIKAEVITSFFSDKVNRILDVVISAVMSAFFLFVTWCTLQDAIKSFVRNELVRTADFLLPTWPARWLVPIGFGLMALYALYQAFHGARTNREMTNVG